MTSDISITRQEAQKLFEYYRSHRDGIRNNKQMATVCLICGSLHILPKEGEPGRLYCRDCGFPFYRYQCDVCGKTVDGRDPQNPACRSCGSRVCTCGSCKCPAAVAIEEVKT